MPSWPSTAPQATTGMASPAQLLDQRVAGVGGDQQHAVDVAAAQVADDPLAVAVVAGDHHHQRHVALGQPPGGDRAAGR